MSRVSSSCKETCTALRVIPSIYNGVGDSPLLKCMMINDMLALSGYYRYVMHLFPPKVRAEVWQENQLSRISFYELYIYETHVCWWIMLIIRVGEVWLGRDHGMDVWTFEHRLILSVENGLSKFDAYCRLPVIWRFIVFTMFSFALEANDGMVSLSIYFLQRFECCFVSIHHLAHLYFCWSYHVVENHCIHLLCQIRRKCIPVSSMRACYLLIVTIILVLVLYMLYTNDNQVFYFCILRSYSMLLWKVWVRLSNLRNDLKKEKLYLTLH
jgi:hypothetical protein